MMQTTSCGDPQHALLEAAFDSVPNAILVVDADGVCLGSNPAFEQLFGYTAHEVIGKRVIDLIVPESGREAALRLQERVRRGGSEVTETQRRRKDGTAVAVRISVARVKGQDDGRVLFLYTDVSEARQAEAAREAAQSRLERVLASSTAVIYATTVDGDVYTPSWVSENVPRIMGYEVAEALEPTWWYDHLHPDDRAAALGALPRLMSEGSLAFEYRFRQKNGPYRWIRDEARLVRDASGRPQEIFGAWLDVTDMKQAAAAMAEARDLAERAARARSEFLANMSHEIRTPMNAVLGMTELVLDTELAPDQRRSLRLVQQAGETLLTLLNDVLDLSKIEADHLSLESIPFDLRYLIESTTSLLSSRVGDRPIELAADVGQSVPHLVRGDPTRLRQVLTNLLGNAIKFTQRGEVVLSAQAEAPADGLVPLRFAVRDTGIGIASHKLETIFEDFTQADASMTRNYGGTGLGLGIARRLVALMGGRIQVQSVQGEGSEFSFTIALPVEETTVAQAPEVGAIAGHRVLVVDDNATNRRIVREMLLVADVTVEGTASADEGLDTLRRAAGGEQPYTLVIVDAQMPQQDGFALAGAIRADAALGHLPLLMLTSAGQRGDAQRCRELGIQGYLMKPISRSDLLEAVGMLVSTGGTTSGLLVTHHTMAESRRHLRILLAEDNPVNQEVAAAMLRKRGHVVDVVENGRLAVQRVSAASYDLVLMDVQMPELDGFAATRAIRAGAVNADVPILALTAHALDGERDRCLAGGMNGYVPKPFRPHELFSAVESFGRDERTVPAQGAAPAGAALDLSSFQEAMREAGAEDAVDGILALFVESAPERVAAVTAAVDAGDHEALDRAVHSFKSAAGLIGARALVRLLGQLETIARSGALDGAGEVRDRVVEESEAVLRSVAQSRREPPG